MVVRGLELQGASKQGHQPWVRPLARSPQTGSLQIRRKDTVNLRRNTSCKVYFEMERREEKEANFEFRRVRTVVLTCVLV